MSIKGFTLVELLIVMAILVSVLTFGIASYTAFNRRERVRQTALTLKSNLRLAQTKAISAQKPSSGCTTYVGTNVSFTASTYTVQHQCAPEGNVGSIETVTLPRGIVFSPVPSAFTFFTRTNTTNLNTERTLSLTNLRDTYDIAVSPSGNVSEDGFQ